MAEPTYSETIPTRLGFYVYRLWAADGTCLYVGCTGERSPKRVRTRLSDHQAKKPWWPQVVRIDVAAFGGPSEVIEEERRQVAALKPAHNQKLLGRCIKGHDVTARNALSQDGKCRRCVRERNAQQWSNPESSTRRSTRKRTRRRRLRLHPEQGGLW